MSGKFVRTIALGALFAGVIGAPLLAAPPVNVVKGRIANLQELGTAFKNLNDQLKMDSPTPYFIQLQVREINTYAKAIYGWFPAGSGPQPGIKTKAKPEIWTQPVQFKAALDAFAAQAKALSDASSTGDLDKVRVPAKLLAQTCASCHRAFRTD
jgi:cytochrome c556